MTATLDEQYAAAESITRDQARNFYYGIRLLPRSKRSALCALYALARRIDDIGDGDLPPADKRARLETLRRRLADVEAAAAGASLSPLGDDAILMAVADAARRFPVPVGAFGELVDGVEMDVSGRRYETFDELTDYCRCVAGAIGRLCLGVFGHDPDESAPAYANALGIALQQVNILRDVREDLLGGRIYLPAQDLARFGVELRLGPDGRLVDDNGALTELVRYAAERARRWYLDGLRLVPLLDRRSAACCTAMSGIYLRLLDEIAADPTRVFGGRLSLSGWRKAGVAAKALAGRAS